MLVVGAMGGGRMPWPSGPVQRKRTELLPRLGLGTMYIASLHGKTNLTTRVWV